MAIVNEKNVLFFLRKLYSKQNSRKTYGFYAYFFVYLDWFSTLLNSISTLTLSKEAFSPKDESFSTKKNQIDAISSCSDNDDLEAQSKVWIGIIKSK